MDSDDEDTGPALTMMYDARIIRIEYTSKRHEWIGPLVRSTQPELFPRFDPSNRLLTYELAVRIFKGMSIRGGAVGGNGGSGGAGSSGGSDDAAPAADDEPLDLDAVMATAGYDDSDDADLVFDQAWERRFAALRSVIGATAECLVEYSPGRPPAAGDASTSSKRARPAARLRATVYGEWPVLSDCVRYDIAALPFAGGAFVAPNQRTLAVGGAPAIVGKFDALRASCYILPHASVRASVGDLHSLLKHTLGLHATVANTLVRKLVPRAYSEPDPAPADADAAFNAPTAWSGEVGATLRGPDGVGAVDTARPLDNTYELAELRLALAHSSNATWHTFDSPKVFVQAAPFFFFSAELRVVADAYRAKNRWFDVLARGRRFVEHIYEMLCTRPHVLCIKRLKFVECVQRQKALKAQRRRLVGSQNAARSAIALVDAECAAMRALLTLPERGLEQYRTTLALNAARGHRSALASEAEQAVVVVAVDVYALIVHDTAARDDLYANPTHKKRVEQSEHGSSSGHMFTVFDSTPRSAIVGHDTSGALGTLSLDDWPLVPLHSALPPIERPASSVAHAPSDDDAEWDDVDAGSLALPRSFAQPRQQWQQPLALPVVATPASAGRTRLVNELGDAVARLAVGCRHEQFVAALRWLIEATVLTRVPMLGSGPRNRGRAFDAFYLSSIHAAQAKCVATMRDIYERGLALALLRDTQRRAPTYDAAAEAAAHATAVRQFEEKSAFFSRARDFARALGQKHAALLTFSRDFATSGGGAAQDVGNDLVLAEAPDLVSGSAHAQELTPARVLSMGQRLLAEVRAFVAGAAPPVDLADPYHDLLPVPAAGERQLHFGLLQDPVCADAEADENEMCGEQIDAVRRALRSPLAIITGRGGTGKTTVLGKLIKRYPPGQVLVTAFTGKVVSELTRRVHPASTMHSLLYRDVLHKQECRRIEGILASLRTRARSNGESDGELARITDVRAELYRLLGVAEHQSPFEGVRVLVIDEASLMPFSMFEALITAIHDHGRRTGKFLARLIICGDPWQLYPIGFGAVLSDLCHAYPWCVHHMTINHRSEGTEIFALNNNIAQQRFGVRGGCPFPAFGGSRNEGRLLTSTAVHFDGTETAEQQDEARRRADDASVVFVSAAWKSLPTQLRDTLQLLGALTDPPTAESQAKLEQIIMVAPTRNGVTRLNTIARALFFQPTFEALGAQMQTSNVTGELLLPGEFLQRIVPGELIILKSNWKTTHLVEDEAGELGDDLGGASIATAPSAAVDRLEEVAFDCGLATTAPTRRVITSYYNGELLRVVQFYDTPARIADATYCRCGLCPPPPPQVPGSPPPRSACVLQPFEVPVGRRTRANLANPATIKWHTQGMRYLNGALEHNDRNKRRMAVFNVVNQPDRYKEVDVGARLASAAQYAFAEAATVHVIQGSEAPTVFFDVTSDNSHIDWSMVYTACTRPRQRLVVIGDPANFQSMVRRQPPIRRSDMFRLLALDVGAVHAKYHDAADTQRIARALAIDDDPITSPLVDTDRAITELPAHVLWTAYDRVKTAALNRRPDE